MIIFDDVLIEFRMKIESFKPDERYNNICKEIYDLILIKQNDRDFIPVIDDCSYDIVFYKERNCKFLYGENNEVVDIRSGIFTIHNLNSPPYKLVSDSKVSFVTLKFHPWMNSYLFGSLKRKGIVDLAKDNEELRALHENIFNTYKSNERFELLNAFLNNLEVSFSNRMLFVKSVCENVFKQDGKVSVNDLCNEFGKSRQYLNRAFKQEVLYSLKHFIITVRILSLIKFKLNENSITLTELCYDYGYFDQSHFIRDFKRVCGVTPKYFFENLSEFMLRHK